MALRNGDEMDIKEISVRNFKSLYDVSFEPGKINVLIGANGSGSNWDSQCSNDGSGK